MPWGASTMALGISCDAVLSMPIIPGWAGVAGYLLLMGVHFRRDSGWNARKERDEAGGGGGAGQVFDGTGARGMGLWL